MGAAVHAAAGRRRPALRHLVGDRWFVDETYVKVAGRWCYVYRAIDQVGQVIDVCVSPQRDAKAARRCLEQTTKITPVEVITDKAATSPTTLGELLPAAWHRTDQDANRHCCIEPECAGEAQQRGGSPSWKDAKKGTNHSSVP